MTPITDPPVQAAPRALPFALTAGVLAGTSAVFFTRGALDAGASPLLIAAFRLTVAALVMTPIVTARSGWREVRALGGRDLALAAFGGAWMALHFILWSSAVLYASILVATVLVTSSPIWTALLEITFLRARLTRLVIVGLLIAVAGNVLLAVASEGGASAGRDELLGGALALGAAVAIAAQRTIGRGLRARLSLAPFLWLLYGAAAVMLVTLAILTRTTFIGEGVAPDAYFWMLLLAIFPQLTAHSAFNYALRYLPATVVSLLIQIEPILATFIAFLLYGEVPLPLQLVGGGVIMLGVVLAIMGRRS